MNRRIATMRTFKLEKHIKLYKPQFDKFNLMRTGGYELDRTSLELDSILFRIKYMIRKGYEGYEDYKKKFTEKAIRLQSLFGEFMLDFLVDIIGVSRCDIVDILAKDVTINTSYVEFTMIVISSNPDTLNNIENTISGDIFNMFPNEYFRFQTDSYNDAIAKAFPELFENKRQTVVGVGDDADVFVHNLTFQTTERCSLNCTYCLGKGTKIAVKSPIYHESSPAKYAIVHKNIEDIKVGDLVASCKEYRPSGLWRSEIIPSITFSRVTKLFHHKEKCYRITVNSHYVHGKTTYITGNHPILTYDNRWVEVKDIKPSDDLAFYHDNEWTCECHGEKFKYLVPIKLPSGDYKIELDDEVRDVYNFETEEHTYVADLFPVHNCYQFNKTPMRMEFDTAKKFIDHLLNDDYGYINRYNSPAIIVEFIGGEPLLEVKLTRQIYEYFLDRCYELNHPWFTLHRVSICSNGLQYFDEDTQEFFKDYASNISFNISIDGNKQLHDSCRIQPNGQGSYDIAMAALNHFNAHYTSERNSKMTLAPSNVKYLFDSVVDFINNGMKCINLNCVFEEGWTRETANIEYYQLKQLADYLIDNNLENTYIALFTDRQEGVQDKHNDGSSCGGAGSMTAIRPNGQIYPCIRYMPTSVGNDVRDMCMGTVDTGWDDRSSNSEVIRILDRVTRRGSTNDICFNCPLSNNCAGCIALGHAVYGTPNHKTTFHCIQHIAEALVNVYYWNKLIISRPNMSIPVRHNVVPDEWALLIIDKDELDLLKELENKRRLLQ